VTEPPAPADAITTFLIWEDDGSGGAHWWLSRAHDAGEDGVARDFFIAEDDIAGCLVVMMREAGRADYQVVAAPRLKNYADPADALADAKACAVLWLRHPSQPLEDGGVLGWRLRRTSLLIWKQLPLISIALFTGAVLGLIVALFSVSSQLVGWPMLATGLAVGAGAGPVLKYIVERRFKSTVGAWARFLIVTLSALTGAAATTGGVLFLFWT
jgi:hypothetical protein